MPPAGQLHGRFKEIHLFTCDVDAKARAALNKIVNIFHNIVINACDSNVPHLHGRYVLFGNLKYTENDTKITFDVGLFSSKLFHEVEIFASAELIYVHKFNYEKFKNPFQNN